MSCVFCDIWNLCRKFRARSIAPFKTSGALILGLTQFWSTVRYSKFLCLVKACENPHWFLFHKWLPIVHRLAARRRRSGEGRSCQYFQLKNSKFSIFSYKYVIYLKWKLKLCRIQIHDKTIWFVSKKLGKKSIFLIFSSKARLTRCLRRLISQIVW